MSSQANNSLMLAMIAKSLQNKRRVHSNKKDGLSKEPSNEKIQLVPYEGTVYNTTAFNASFSQSHQDFYTPTIYKN